MTVVCCEEQVAFRIIADERRIDLIGGLLSLLSVLGSWFLYPLFEAWIPVAARRTLGVTLLGLVAKNAFMLLVLFGTYRVLHWALRFRAVERLVVMPSLTHFRFWRRYRAPTTKLRGQSNLASRGDARRAS